MKLVFSVQFDPTTIKTQSTLDYTYTLLLFIADKHNIRARTSKNGFQTSRSQLNDQSRLDIATHKYFRRTNKTEKQGLRIQVGLEKFEDVFGIIATMNTRGYCSGSWVICGLMVAVVSCRRAKEDQGKVATNPCVANPRAGDTRLQSCRVSHLARPTTGRCSNVID